MAAREPLLQSIALGRLGGGGAASSPLRAPAPPPSHPWGRPGAPSRRGRCFGGAEAGGGGRGGRARRRGSAALLARGAGRSHLSERGRPGCAALPPLPLPASSRAVPPRAVPPPRRSRPPPRAPRPAPRRISGAVSFIGRRRTKWKMNYQCPPPLPPPPGRRAAGPAPPQVPAAAAGDLGGGGGRWREEAGTRRACAPRTSRSGRGPPRASRPAPRPAGPERRQRRQRRQRRAGPSGPAPAPCRVAPITVGFSNRWKAVNRESCCGIIFIARGKNK